MAILFLLMDVQLNNHLFYGLLPFFSTTPWSSPFLFLCHEKQTWKIKRETKKLYGMWFPLLHLTMQKKVSRENISKSPNHFLCTTSPFVLCAAVAMGIIFTQHHFILFHSYSSSGGYLQPSPPRHGRWKKKQRLNLGHHTENNDENDVIRYRL